MGLDQYANIRFTTPETPVDFKGNEEAIELHYWRKHANLQGWMERLYRDKGGQAESFNCVPVVLTLEDLDRLERDTRAGELPHTTGFFFGESQPEDYDSTLDFITKARKAIAAGHTVYYSSWW